jgi:hypothetical protein
LCVADLAERVSLIGCKGLCHFHRDPSLAQPSGEKNFTGMTKYFKMIVFLNNVFIRPKPLPKNPRQNNTLEGCLQGWNSTNKGFSSEWVF